jgi:hypothetical protein
LGFILGSLFAIVQMIEKFTSIIWVIDLLLGTWTRFKLVVTRACKARHGSDLAVDHITSVNANRGPIQSRPAATPDQHLDAPPWAALRESHIKLPVAKKRLGQVHPHYLQCLPLGLVDSHGKCGPQRELPPACPSPVPNPPVLAHLHLESAATVLPTALSSQEHKTPFPSPVTD